MSMACYSYENGFSYFCFSLLWENSMYGKNFAKTTWTSKKLETEKKMEIYEIDANKT